jgi:type II secretory pathway pseudopilin PulG
MTKEASRVRRFSGFVIHSSFVIRHSSFLRRRRVARENCRGVCVKRRTNRSGARRCEHRHIAAFTLIELLTVITIIIVLAGLILATIGYVQKKGARSRAEAEIAAISAACESYKADNGIYPSTNNTNNLDPATAFDPTKNDLAKYAAASFDLYAALTGDLNGDRQIGAGETGKSYMAFKPNQLSPTDQTKPVQYVRDPFGNSYGYSTAKASNPGGTAGYNPTFDLWSTCGGSSSTDVPAWIKNW